MKRLLFAVSASVLLALLASFVVVGTILHWSLTESFEKVMPPQVRVGTAALSVMVEGAPLGTRDEVLERFEALSGSEAEIVYPEQLANVPQHVQDALHAGEPALERLGSGQALVFVPIDDGAAIVRVHSDLEMPAPTTGALVVGILALLVIVFGTGTAMVLPFVRRMKRLEQTVERIATGDLDARSDDEGTDPVGHFAQGFNTMADRVQELLTNQRQLLQAVAHELRTPTARVRFGLEMLEVAPDRAARDARLKAIDDDLEEIDELVRELHVFNLADAAGGLVLDEQPLGGLVAEVVDGLRHLRQDIALEVEACQSCRAKVDTRAAKRAIQNLVSNALRYAESKVMVRCRTEPGAVSVEVLDDGPGVPESERHRILEPFARLDDSRNKDSGGVGLGLAIVDRVMKAHAGSVLVTDSDLGGACFVLRWPPA